jgi:hypothetical protein
VIGNVAPERVAPGFTGRLFFLDTLGCLLEDRPGFEPGTLFRFVHRVGRLQKNRDIQYPSPPDQAVDTRADQLGKSTPLNAAYYPVIGKIQGLPNVIWTIFLNFGLECGELQDGQMKPSLKSLPAR